VYCRTWRSNLWSQVADLVSWCKWP